MSEVPHDKIPERIARLEEGMVDLDRAVTGIKNAVDSIASDVRKSQQPHWGNLIGWGGLLMGVAGGLWTLGIGPLREAQDGTRAMASRNTDRIQGLETREAGTHMKLAEVETQFRESRNIKNMQFEFGLILTNLTRREVGLKEFDMPRFYPLPTDGAVK